MEQSRCFRFGKRLACFGRIGRGVPSLNVPGTEPVTNGVGEERRELCHNCTPASGPRFSLDPPLQDSTSTPELLKYIYWSLEPQRWKRKAEFLFRKPVKSLLRPKPRTCV